MFHQGCERFHKIGTHKDAKFFCDPSCSIFSKMLFGLTRNPKPLSWKLYKISEHPTILFVLSAFLSTFNSALRKSAPS